MGIRALRQARYADAEKYFRTAVERLTAGYTSPKDGEPFYYLGVALKAQGRNDRAFDAFYKAAWSAGWQSPSYLALAEIASARGDTAEALSLASRSLQNNALNTRALNLKAALLRHLGRKEEARTVLAQAIAADPLDVRTATEEWLLGAGAAKVATIYAEHPATALEAAVEYSEAGMYQDATAVLLQAKPSALGYYYLADFAAKLKQPEKAREFYASARAASPDFVFPFQHEAVSMFRRAMEANPKDARAPYYLGNLLFDWQPAEAIALWERSRSLDGSFPIVHRNLGIAYARQQNALDKAIASLERAVSLGKKYPIHFFELDGLYEAAGTPPEKRLEILERNHTLVAERDDTLAREISLKIFAGKYDEAIRFMTGRHFNVWEGGARFNVHDSWTDAHLLRGHRHFAANRYKDALADYERSLQFPEGLQTARHRTGGRFAEVAYWIGLAQQALGRNEDAQRIWKEAAAARIGSGSDDILATADTTVLRFYQALALSRLGERQQAADVFRRLVEAGAASLKRPQETDIFAKFGEGQTPAQRAAQAHFIAALGYSGLGEPEKAKAEFGAALRSRPDHLGARDALDRMK
jgi:tetratricopeptide (TPR) repeat protein